MAVFGCGVFFLLFGYLILTSILFPRYQQLQGIITLDALLAILLLVGMVWLWSRAWVTRFASDIARSQIFWPVLAGIFLLHLFLALSLVIDPTMSGWDPQTIFQAAEKISSGVGLSPSEMTYFQAYSNNLGIVALAAVLMKSGAVFGVHAMASLLIIFNVVCMNVALVLTYFCVKKVINDKAALFALVLGIIFITFSLWSRTFYSDTVGMLFPVAMLFIVIHLNEASSRRKWLLVAALGIVAGLGYLIKPTTIFVLIAAGLVFGLRSAIISLRTRTYFYKVGGALLVVVFGWWLMSTFISQMTAKRLEVAPHSMPLSSFMMLGLSKVCTPSECRYGAWNMPDALKYDEMNNPEQYKTYTESEVRHRLSTYGIGGYAAFLSEKGAWIMGDGTFYAYGEGVEKEVQPTASNWFSRLVQKVMFVSGKWFGIFQNTAQTWWIVLCILVLMPFFWLRRREFEPVLSTVYISLLGLLVFLLLFEARSRYLYLYIPLFIIAAAYGFNLLVMQVKGIRFIRKII